MHPSIEHTYAKALPDLVAAAQGEAHPDARLVLLNEELATELGFDPEWLRSPEGIEFLLGHGEESYAMAYAGYQFGQFNPRMGDGRALLLGEVVDGDGARWDLHAKGTGRTPFSRPGSDGRGTLRSMLREYLVSSALHALCVPTTRPLAVLSTGRKIQRQLVEPAGVIVRVAASHIRVGTVHYAQMVGDDTLRALADVAIERHYPDLAAGDYTGLYESVMASQIRTVAAWQRLGFLHGVMNTDNTTLSGETIDFGPCAFVETFDHDTVYSSIDTQGRYRFGHQPGVLGWNLARLAESMLPLFDTDPNEAVSFAQETINGFYDVFETEHHAQLAQALGLDPAASRKLTTDLLAALPGHDLTQTLAALRYGGDVPPGALTEWQRCYAAAAPAAPSETGPRVPVVIPRNLAVEAALRDAPTDMSQFHRLLDAVTHPFTPNDEFEAPSAPAQLEMYRTYCGT